MPVVHMLALLIYIIRTLYHSLWPSNFAVTDTSLGYTTNPGPEITKCLGASVCEIAAIVFSPTLRIVLTQEAGSMKGAEEKNSIKIIKQ